MTDTNIDAIHATTRYTMWSVFQLATTLPDDETTRRTMVREALEAVGGATSGLDSELTIRGWYNISGLRADADLMVWWHGDSIEAVQGAYQRLRKSELGRCLEPVWSNVGLHRAAEFNRGHIPAFMADETPEKYICVYPFVRSYEWYILDPAKRSQMLREHGEAAADYADVRANTVSSFALGDYEWLLAFEAPALDRIVDLMRDLRATEARLHVREELPFFTGPRVDLYDWADQQPTSSFED
ncbi:hydrogen peroxide-dependent heme synthase [Jonesia quinghaiensis]|uniref:hydrogen peroxide-dependent heme synthase n=1 Tax=Jonesia quinghaiensis TaxID=262806 RepID=UPI00042191C0|nr:hydrogen peroxide-dependent heme synthase [Jonesia quinghaiensis]